MSRPVDSAPEAPWAQSWFDDSPRGETYGVKSADAVICYTNREKAGYDDARLIASCFNAVRAISALHERLDEGYQGLPICAECSNAEVSDYVSWPCPTINAIVEAPE